MGFNQTSFTVRENDRVVDVCAKFTKYSMRPECPMAVTINVNIAAVHNTAGNTHSVFLTILFVGTYNVKYVSVYCYTLPINVILQM